jgi:hypothetical protein
MEGTNSDEEKIIENSNLTVHFLFVFVFGCSDAITNGSTKILPCTRQKVTNTLQNGKRACIFDCLNFGQAVAC